MTHFDRVAALTHSTFNSIMASVPENMAGRKIIAGIVMKRGDGDCGTVVSLGTGECGSVLTAVTVCVDSLLSVVYSRQHDMFRFISFQPSIAIR